MGVSTNGQICYGLIFEEGFEFPWDDEKFDYDIDTWWVYGVLGFERSFEMFTPEGDWIGGEVWPEEKREAYYQERRNFEDKNPKLPIELINYCSCDAPMYILAVPESYKFAWRGYPTEFNPAELTVTSEQEAKLLEFCADHGIEYEGKPEWYLSSLWC